jgi:hypothetical protein
LFNLHEVEWSGLDFPPSGPGTLVNRGSISVGVVASSQRVIISFSEIIQHWRWIIPGVWVIADQWPHTFVYTLSGSFQDQYGNQYQLSTNLRAVVSVSDVKYLAGMAAMGSAIIAAAYVAAAAIAALVPFVGWATAGSLLAAAGYAYLAATMFGAATIDPPEPDMNYQEKVQIVPVELPKKLTESSEFPQLAYMLKLVGTLIQANTALDKIQGKRMGAAKAGDEQSLKMQTSSYEDVQNQMASYAKALSDSIPKVTAEFESKEFLTKDNIMKELISWQKRGLPDKIRKAALDAGLTEEILANFQQIVEKPPVTIEEMSEMGSGKLKWITDHILKWSSVIMTKKPDPV